MEEEMHEKVEYLSHDEEMLKIQKSEVIEEKEVKDDDENEEYAYSDLDDNDFLWPLSKEDEKRFSVKNMPLPVNSKKRPAAAVQAKPKNVKKSKTKEEPPKKRVLPKRKKKDEEDTKKMFRFKLGALITLLANKNDLAKCGSLITNEEVPIWFRDPKHRYLMQKFTHESYDDKTKSLFYKGTMIYSCYQEEENASNFIQVQGEVVEIFNSMTGLVKIKINNLGSIEELCSNLMATVDDDICNKENYFEVAPNDYYEEEYIEDV